MITGLPAYLGTTPIGFVVAVAEKIWLKSVLRMSCKYQPDFKYKQVLCSMKKGVPFWYAISK